MVIHSLCASWPVLLWLSLPLPCWWWSLLSVLLYITQCRIMPFLVNPTFIVGPTHPHLYPRGRPIGTFEFSTQLHGLIWKSIGDGDIQVGLRWILGTAYRNVCNSEQTISFLDLWELGALEWIKIYSHYKHSYNMHGKSITLVRSSVCLL